MKKILRKTLSMLLAVSALCILFAFQASAVTTQCPYCSAYYNYNMLPFDPRHECICINHGIITEEPCEPYDYDEDYPDYHFCACGRNMGLHVFNYEYVDFGEGHYSFCECTWYITEGHTFSGGICTDCGHIQ